VLAWCLNPGLPDPDAIDALVQGADTVNVVMSTLSILPYEYPYTAERTLRMLRDLYTEGFAAQVFCCLGQNVGRLCQRQGAPRERLDFDVFEDAFGLLQL
jgi:hypothetical protein